MNNFNLVSKKHCILYALLALCSFCFNSDRVIASSNHGDGKRSGKPNLTIETNNETSSGNNRTSLENINNTAILRNRNRAELRNRNGRGRVTRQTNPNFKKRLFSDDVEKSALPVREESVNIEPLESNNKDSEELLEELKNIVENNNDLIELLQVLLKNKEDLRENDEYLENSEEW